MFMKTTLVVLTLITTMTMSSFTRMAEPRRVFPNALSSEQMAIRALDALKQSSAVSYTALYPSLAEFYAFMDAHAGVYGDQLPEAKTALGRQYENCLLPAVKQSFRNIREAGKARGIRWNTAQYIRTECTAAADNACATVTIVFSAHGKEHHLRIEKAVVLNGEWKLSELARLI